MHATASTVRLRPVRIPALSPEAIQANVVRNWFAVTGEARAKRLLLAIEPTSGKIARRSREGLRAAIKILGTDPVDVRDVAEILRGMGDNISHLCNVRLGYLSDASLWEDAAVGMGNSQFAATRRCAEPCAASDAVVLLGRSLGVVEALLSVPEGERAVVVGAREVA
ncbi:hypothetical protein [Aureimonas sp. SK2]|uniref:hypothetical protein n=1 Tax=Aureimonas sp. SK2 TaxID=3015992 RepID=UPI002445024D|nr:hypothetical protein [Aureimonas sp. SK2]